MNDEPLDAQLKRAQLIVALSTVSVPSLNELRSLAEQFDVGTADTAAIGEKALRKHLLEFNQITEAISERQHVNETQAKIRREELASRDLPNDPAYIEIKRVKDEFAEQKALVDKILERLKDIQSHLDMLGDKQSTSQGAIAPEEMPNKDLVYSVIIFTAMQEALAKQLGEGQPSPTLQVPHISPPPRDAQEARKSQIDGVLQKLNKELYRRAMPPDWEPSMDFGEGRRRNILKLINAQTTSVNQRNEVSPSSRNRSGETRLIDQLEQRFKTQPAIMNQLNDRDLLDAISALTEQQEALAKASSESSAPPSRQVEASPSPAESLLARFIAEQQRRNIVTQGFLDIKKTLLETTLNMWPRKAITEAALSVVQTVESKIPSSYFGKGSVHGTSKDQKDLKGRVVDVLIEDALVGFALDKHRKYTDKKDANASDEELAKYHTATKVIRLFRQGDRPNDFTEIRKGLVESLGPSAEQQMPTQKTVDARTDEAPIETAITKQTQDHMKLVAGLLIGQEGLPAVELTEMDKSRGLPFKTLRRAMSGPDLASLLADSIEGKPVIPGQGKKFKDKFDKLEKHELSGQQFTGEIIALNRNAAGLISKILVKQVAPKPDRPTFHELSTAEIRFAIMAGDKATDKEIQKGQTFQFKLPKRLHQIDEDRLEKFCDVYTPDTWREKFGAGEPLKGPIVNIGTGVYDHIPEGTIFVEIPAAQKVRVQIMMITPNVHKVTDFRELKIGANVDIELNSPDDSSPRRARGSGNKP